jgi:hypothetical protein
MTKQYLRLPAIVTQLLVRLLLSAALAQPFVIRHRFESKQDQRVNATTRPPTVNPYLRP